MDIWQKGSTFPQPCLDELKVKLANAMASAGSSKYADGAGVKKELKSSSLASGESRGSGKSFSQPFFFLIVSFGINGGRVCAVVWQWGVIKCLRIRRKKKGEFSNPGKLGTQLLLRLLVNVSIVGICAAKRRQNLLFFLSLIGGCDGK